MECVCVNMFTQYIGHYIEQCLLTEISIMPNCVAWTVTSGSTWNFKCLNQFTNYHCNNRVKII